MRSAEEEARLCAALQDAFAMALPDPALAPSIAVLGLSIVAHRVGWHPPTERERREARAYELLAEVGATHAAERLDVGRATVYRMAARHQARLRSAA